MPSTIVTAAALFVVAQALPQPAPAGTTPAEAASVVRPTPIRLNIDKRTLPEIVADLSAQAPMQVMLPPGPTDPVPVDRPGPVLSTQRFTLRKTGTVPFWEAIDRVCRTTQRWPGIAVFRDPSAPVTAPGAPSVEPDPKVVLVPASRDRGFAYTDGAFRIVIARLSYGRDIRFTPALFPQPGADVSSHDRPADETFFSAELIIMAEPRLKIERVGDLTVHEAIDDRGQSLIAGGSGRQALSGRQGVIPPDGAAISVPVALGYPGEPGKWIKRLRGALPLEVSERKAGLKRMATVVNFGFADIPMP